MSYVPSLSLPEYFQFIMATIVPGFTFFMCWCYLFGWKKWEALSDMEKLFLAITAGFVCSFLAINCLKGYYSYFSGASWEITSIFEVSLKDLYSGGFYSTFGFLALFGYPWYFKNILCSKHTSVSAFLGTAFWGVISSFSFSFVIFVLARPLTPPSILQLLPGPMTLGLLSLPIILLGLKGKRRLQRKK